MYVIKTFLIDKKLNKKHFVEKSCRKCAPKFSSRPIFQFWQIQNSHCMQEILLKRCFHYHIALKKLTLIFRSYPVPFHGLQFGKK